MASVRPHKIKITFIIHNIIGEKSHTRTHSLIAIHNNMIQHSLFFVYAWVRCESRSLLRSSTNWSSEFGSGILSFSFSYSIVQCTKLPSPFGVALTVALRLLYSWSMSPSITLKVIELFFSSIASIICLATLAFPSVVSN